MALTFPNKTVAENIYVSGLNHTIDNYGKNVTLYFPARLEVASGSVPDGNLGMHFLSDGSTTFQPADNHLAGGQAMVEVRDSKSLNMLCTVSSQNREAKFKRDESVGIQFKKELTYIYGKFYMAEYHNVVNADYAIFDIPEQDIDKMKFRLASHPRDKNSIGQGRYLCCWWEQIP